MGLMKTYRSLMESLPSKTVVFAFGRFNPPTTGHQLLVSFVKKMAQQNKADHVIFASHSQDAKKNPLSVERKLHYLNLMFPGMNFAASGGEVRTFMEAAKMLNKKYKNLVMVAGGERVAEFDKILNKYNGVDYNFDSIRVISAGERDPDSDDVSGMSASKMRAVASKGDIAQFKRGLPSTIREIDARRLMNDVREGMGLEVIKENIKLPYNELREKYVKGEIYQEGHLVESINGETFTIVKRGTNYLLVKDSDGNVHSKWLHEVVEHAK